MVSRYLIQPAARIELGPRLAELNFAPAGLDPAGFGAFELAGAWTVTSGDPRLGGVSALAVDGAELIALTDSGVLIRFPKPGKMPGRAAIRELPGGPGDPRFKVSRDSESLVRDPLGRGWWVAFENRNELWLYDPGFDRALQRIQLGKKRWRRNSGIEGLASDGLALLLFPEPGRTVVRVSGARQRTLPIANARGRISDAARLPDGQVAVLHRSLGIAGFRNAVSMLEPTRRGYRVTGSNVLGFGAFDNAEAIAAEQLPAGRIRLWIMTDDNFRRPLRTLLVALDLPVRRPAEPPSLRLRA